MTLNRLLSPVTGSNFLWGGPSHTFQGNNWVAVLDGTLVFAGLVLILGGFGLLTRIVWGRVLCRRLSALH